MIVLDASAAVLALLNDGPARDLVASEAIAVPHLIDAEVAQVIRSQALRETLTAEAGTAALAVWSQLGLHRYAATGLLPRVWELRDNLSAYDALYVALAESLRVDLVTADARLARAPGTRCTVTTLRH